jgi:cell surface protein SprA
VSPKKRKEEQGWYKAMEYTARGLMMVRNISVSYRNSNNMSIPGFLPNIGDYFGQRSSGGLQPGLDFAFGFAGEDYINKAAERGWLLQSDSVITPATINMTEELQIKATIEPLKNFKIDLSASRNVNKAKSIQYMFEGMPTTQNGSFTMTTISIGTAFEKGGTADNGYRSKNFQRFVNSLDKYQQKIEKLYAGATYPAGSTLSGQKFDPANGTVNKYSAEVMIPAFLDTYCVGGGSLDIFPALTRLLPNWNISYSGLSKLKRMKKIFKSFNINHGYKSIYSIGSYNTFNSYQEYMNGFGFVQDVATGNPVPSCMYDISTVSINESFSPLIGIDMTFNNNLTAKVEFRKTRVLTLSMTSQQINETRSDDIVFGVGYKINDLNLFAPKKKVKKSQKGNDSSNKAKTTNSRGFSNDLNMRLDFSIRNQSALNRDILTTITQATSGNKAVQVSFSADYTLSKYLTITAYYDRQMNKPLLTSSSYPITTQDFGISLKFMLNR